MVSGKGFRWRLYGGSGLSWERHPRQGTGGLSVKAGQVGICREGSVRGRQGVSGLKCLAGEGETLVGEDQADSIFLALGSDGLHHLCAAGWDGTGHSEKVSAKPLPTPSLLSTLGDLCQVPSPLPAPSLTPAQGSWFSVTPPPRPCPPRPQVLPRGAGPLCKHSTGVGCAGGACSAPGRLPGDRAQ